MPTFMLRDKKKTHSAEVLQEIRLLQFEGSFTDVVLISELDGRRFSCHRLVLAACSKFFKALFLTPMLESSVREVRLGEVNGDELLLLITFCYEGYMELDFDYDLKPLLYTASLLQISAAVEACCKYFKRILDYSNCLETYAMAEELSLDNLKQHVQKFINSHYEQVCKCQAFLELSYSNLVRLITSDVLVVPSEEVVFESVMSWVNEDKLVRSEYIPKLIRLVRLPLLNSFFLMKRVKPLCSEPDWLDRLFDEPSQSSPQQMTPRKGINQDILAFFWTSEKTDIQRYCTIADSWKSKGHTSITTTSAFAAVFLDDMFIVLGGFDGQSTLKTFCTFKVNYKNRCFRAPMIYARKDLGAAVVDNQIYAIGGRNEKSVLKEVERCIFKNIGCSWHRVADMIIARRGHGVAVLNGLIYVAGGCNNQGALSTTESYDPVRNQWTQRASMNRRRYRFNLAAGRGCLFAISGCDETNYTKIVERYNPAIDRWTQICSLNQERIDASCVFIGDRLLALGGFYVNKKRHLISTNSVEEYDFETDTWTKSTPLPFSAYRNFKAVAMPMLNYTHD